MIDGGLWNYIRPLISPFGRATRVENLLGKGTPDVAWTFGGVSGWLELKYEKNKMAGAMEIKSLTLEQVIWLEEEVASGGRAWVLLKFGTSYLLLKPWVVRLIFDGRVDVDDTRRLATKTWLGQIKPLELIECMKKI